MIDVEFQKEKEGFVGVSVSFGGTDPHTNSGIMFVPKKHAHNTVYRVLAYAQDTGGNLHHPRRVSAKKQYGKWFLEGSFYKEKYAGKFIRLSNRESWENGETVEVAE